MGRVEVIECDGCGRYIDKMSNAFKINLESIGTIPCAAGGHSEHKDIYLELCVLCSKNLTRTLTDIYSLMKKGKK